MARKGRKFLSQGVGMGGNRARSSDLLSSARSCSVRSPFSPQCHAMTRLDIAFSSYLRPPPGGTPPLSNLVPSAHPLHLDLKERGGVPQCDHPGQSGRARASPCCIPILQPRLGASDGDRREKTDPVRVRENSDFLTLERIKKCPKECV